MVMLWRRAPAFALLTAIGLLMAGIVLAVVSERAYRAQKIDEFGVTAEIVASSVGAALAFSDRQTAQEYVNALQANEQVQTAAVYAGDGSLFAAYARRTELAPPARAEQAVQRFESGQLRLTRPVVVNGQFLGTVYLRALTQTTWQRLAGYSGVALLVVMAALVVVVLGAAQTALARANRELEQRSRELAAANRDLQAQIGERERAEAALRQAQKMETIGQLTGGVAHDFNNLLTIILGNVERLQRRLAAGSDPAELRRAAENIRSGAERAAALTRSLLAFSRRQALDPRAVDVNKLVSDMSSLLRRTLGEQIRIESVGAGGLWRTLVDPNQLENAVLNLAVNARDAMPSGGRLTIETANAYLDDRYAAGQEEVVPGQYVVLSITDTGVGMTRETVEQAFDPFFTTKEIGQGTGLGLSQVYGFVKQSGGHVKIYSEPGEGTTVKIYLPRLHGEEASPEAAADAVAEIAAGDGSEVVLVVEDEEGVRNHSVEILRELGYRVHEAATGEAALRLLERHPAISLLFTDVGLPGGMNGRQLADEACRRRPNLKVLFTTGYARNAIVHDGRLDPGVRLITKPFTYDELGAALRGIFDRRSAEPRILVVEDEPLVRMNLVDLLEELGFRAVEAGTGSAAIHAVRLDAEGIEAAVVDLGLPDRKGDSLIVELRALHPRLPIVVATGASDEAVRGRFASDRLVGFLGKPYDGDGLAAALRAVGVRFPGADG